MKILIITTVSGTVNAFLIPQIEMLINLGHKVDIACRVGMKINNVIIGLGCKIYDIPFERSPLRMNTLEAYKEIKRIVKDYDLIHTHTPVASFVSRFACRGLDDVKVMYTAHGFHFFKGAPLSNWLFYYPLEKWAAKHTDMIVTMNEEDYSNVKKIISKQNA